MKKTVSILVLSLVLALAALVMAERNVPKNSQQTGMNVQELKVPEFTSAAFQSGDALSGLGANWTFLRQNEVGDSEKTDLDGTVLTRESVVKLAGKPIQLILSEAQIIDAGKLVKALKEFETKTVAGRTGYILPAADLAGGTQFALVGTSTVLLVQDANAAQWPEQLDPEVSMYIQTALVP